MTAQRGGCRAGERSRPAAPATRCVQARQGGMVTVETALAIAALVVATLLASGVPVAVATAVRCGDAAREVALLAARGAPPRDIEAATAALAPADSALSISSDGRFVTVVVTADGTSRGPLAGRLSFPVRGRAVAQVESVGTAAL